MACDNKQIELFRSRNKCKFRITAPEIVNILLQLYIMLTNLMFFTKYTHNGMVYENNIMSCF